jgi:hypothetical protein
MRSELRRECDFVKQFSQPFMFGGEFAASRQHRATIVEKSIARLKKSLRHRVKTHISRVPNFARACGRVSVGGYPDKRPDSRQGDEEPRVV